MLRGLFLLLLLLNAAYFAWTHNWLAFAGLVREDVGEQQVTANVGEPLNAEQLTVLTAEQLQRSRQAVESVKPRSEPAVVSIEPLASPVAQTSPAAVVVDPLPSVEPALEVKPPVAQSEPEPKEPPPSVAVQESTGPKVCMAVGAFTAEQFQPIRSVLQRWPATAWQVEEAMLPGRWMVFWGDFDDPLVFAAKRAELQKRSIGFDPLRNSTHGTGFSLGRLSTEEAAKQELVRFQQKGVNGLKVIQERPETPVFVLSFPDHVAYRDRIRTDLSALFAGKALRPC